MITPIVQRRLAAATPPGGSTLPAAHRGPIPALARVPVLVIEDEAMIAWMIESLLEDMGFEEITLASNAKEAIAAAAQRSPELVLSDINLGSGADGIEAVRSIRGTCNPAVVFVSAYIDDDARDRIARHVLDARILSKPLSGDGLFSIVGEALRLNRAN